MEKWSWQWLFRSRQVRKIDVSPQHNYLCIQKWSGAVVILRIRDGSILATWKWHPPANLVWLNEEHLVNFGDKTISLFSLSGNVLSSIPSPWRCTILAPKRLPGAVDDQIWLPSHSPDSVVILNQTTKTLSYPLASVFEERFAIYKSLPEQEKLQYWYQQMFPIHPHVYHTAMIDGVWLGARIPDSAPIVFCFHDKDQKAEERISLSFDFESSQHTFSETAFLHQGRHCFAFTTNSHMVWIEIQKQEKSARILSRIPHTIRNTKFVYLSSLQCLLVNGSTLWFEDGILQPVPMWFSTPTISLDSSTVCNVAEGIVFLTDTGIRYCGPRLFPLDKAYTYCLNDSPFPIPENVCYGRALDKWGVAHMAFSALEDAFYILLVAAKFKSQHARQLLQLQDSTISNMLNSQPLGDLRTELQQQFARQENAFVRFYLFDTQWLAERVLQVGQKHACYLDAMELGPILSLSRVNFENGIGLALSQRIQSARRLPCDLPGDYASYQANRNFLESLQKTIVWDAQPSTWTKTPICQESESDKHVKYRSSIVWLGRRKANSEVQCAFSASWVVYKQKAQGTNKKEEEKALGSEKGILPSTADPAELEEDSLFESEEDSFLCIATLGQELSPSRENNFHLDDTWVFGVDHCHPWVSCPEFSHGNSHGSTEADGLGDDDEPRHISWYLQSAFDQALDYVQAPIC